MLVADAVRKMAADAGIPLGGGPNSRAGTPSGGQARQTGSVSQAGRELGHLGGNARASKLTRLQRLRIATKGAQARWGR